jgi:hypothetical protein
VVWKGEYDDDNPFITSPHSVVDMFKHILENVREKTTFTPSHPPQSPVPHLLSSNATPTEDELKAVLKAIQDAELQTEEMQAEIIQPDAGQAKRLALLQEFIRVHRSLLVRIRNLPPELLQEIFLVYSETSTGYYHWIPRPDMSIMEADGHLLACIVGQTSCIPARNFPFTRQRLLRSSTPGLSSLPLSLPLLVVCTAT